MAVSVVPRSVTDRNRDNGDRYDDPHEPYIRQALDLARKAAANGNTPFGSLLVRGGDVIAESENTTRTEDDITAHPELKLARWAARRVDGEASAVTMYTSTEPCPMCAGAIAFSGLGRVVYSVDGETASELAPGDGPALTSDLLERVDEIELVGPVLEREGKRVHRECWSDDE